MATYGMRCTMSATGWTERTERREQSLAFVEIGSGVRRNEREQRRAVGTRDGCRIDNELVGYPCRDEVAVGAQHFAGATERMQQHAGDHRAHGMQPVRDRRDDAEIAAPTLQRPEEILMLRLARGDQFAVGGHDVVRKRVVAGEAAPSHQPADAAA